MVAAKDFLVLWQVDDLDEEIREEVLTTIGAPSQIGTQFAKKYRGRRADILKLATWNGAELSGSLFLSNPEVVVESIRSFEKSLQQGRKVRQKITPANFVSVLKEMKMFFDQPVKTVRAFYSMVYAWTETSTVQLSHKANDQAALGGEVITNLVAAKRGRFKDFVENRCIRLGASDHVDDFFARYDEALDAVDSDFRVKHGIFFTDRDLSKFVMWLVKRTIPDLGKNYLVIDPACGSGNLVTNWRSPLELRHKVVSEIEPELLFAVERRMKGDQWHNGKFTVVPKVSENKGLNFLDRSAEEYLEELRNYLAEKGQKPDKPLAFLCNPPYRSDDDQSADNISYEVHGTISDLTGMDASSERYCCFLAQMKLICDAAPSNGFPEDSRLLLFTKSAWLTKRAVFAGIRAKMLEAFDNETGILVNGSEFFDVKGKWPVAFSVWKYAPNRANVDAQRSIPLIDLTWLKREQLVQLPWDNPEELESACEKIMSHQHSRTVELGQERLSIREWSGETMLDFKRGRRKSESNQQLVGGLPLGDPRQTNKKAYGETNGRFIGFMDELTPCRVKRSTPDKPWFYLDTRFMSIKKARCLSGPPTHLGYCATNLDSAKKLFFWYALARTFLQTPYPMWIDADNMWEPTIPEKLERTVFQTAVAIGYAENECVEARFPANNPIPGVPELTVNNPMTPLNPASFWSATMSPYCSRPTLSNVADLLGTVDQMFGDWNRLFAERVDLPLTRKPYLLDDGGLTRGAGIIQIKDYAKEKDDKTLLADWSEIQRMLKLAKADFFEMTVAGLDYFGSSKKSAASERPQASDAQVESA